MRKSRTISLRLSEQEFEALKLLYASHGAKSISDFARSAIQTVLSEPVRDTFSLELKVHEIDGKVQILGSEVARLTRLLETELSIKSGIRNAKDR